jgi:hypothetical protein
MHYFYYLKLKKKLFTIYRFDTLQIVFSFFKILPDMFRRQPRAIFRGVFKPNFLP